MKAIKTGTMKAITFSTNTGTFIAVTGKGENDTLPEHIECIGVFRSFTGSDLWKLGNIPMGMAGYIVENNPLILKIGGVNEKE